MGAEHVLTIPFPDSIGRYRELPGGGGVPGSAKAMPGGGWLAPSVNGACPLDVHRTEALTE